MSPPHSVRTSPVVQGFSVVDYGNTYVATRDAPLTEYQLLYGCVAEVVASTPEELHLLCLAERIKAELVAQAEMAPPAGH